MEQEELWEQFVASGRVADYLRFTNGLRGTEAGEDLTGWFPGVALAKDGHEKNRGRVSEETGDEEMRDGI